MIRSSHGGAARPPKRGAASKLRAQRPEGEATREPRARPAGPRTRREGEDRLKKAKPSAPAEGRSLSGSARIPAGVSSASDEAREIAVLIAVAAIEKKASGLEVIDVAGRVDYADFLVLMSGRSDRHVTALSAAIEEALRKKNKRALAVEGLPHASWVLMDFGDVVVHVFQDDARAAYDIDGLWMDARRVPVPLAEPRA
ncbi:MAG TPA: ribosome silencing factor [Labilithrix sp.]|jgi:ribosome-associated protein|nr:ribosome silencing factor [Labilithrix sp.]